ncbi:hypothetical protein BJ508DRAFT_417858 [Ascobolus immersus RN42]|uniref:Uncharacterized protein n=1 Tax=Ascobolus immersus RN42 TaxID=1160509 RepID=A0A3N4HQ54_ASCIM|nr:hypothetical protein BJ508DRAFT_417858 [Ascobolus immersus RN42]
MSTIPSIPRTCYPSLHTIVQKSISHSNAQLAVLGTRCLHTRTHAHSALSGNDSPEARIILERYSICSRKSRSAFRRVSKGNAGLGARHYSSRTVSDSMDIPKRAIKYYGPYMEESPSAVGPDLWRPDGTFVGKNLTWERDELLEKLKQEPELVGEVGTLLTKRFPGITQDHVYTLLSHLADEDHMFMSACLTEILVELEVWPSLKEKYSKEVPPGCELRYFPGSDIVDSGWDRITDGVIGYIKPDGVLEILAIVEAKLGSGNGWASLFRSDIPNGFRKEKEVLDLIKALYQPTATKEMSISLLAYRQKFAKHLQKGGQFLKDLLRLRGNPRLYIQGENKVKGKEQLIWISIDPKSVRFLPVLPCKANKADQDRFIEEESNNGYIAHYRNNFGLRHIYPQFVTATMEDLELISAQVMNIVRKRVESGGILKEHFNDLSLRAIRESGERLRNILKKRPNTGPYGIKRTDQSQLHIPLYDKDRLAQALVDQFLASPPRYETFRFQAGHFSGTFTGNDAHKFTFSTVYPCKSNGTTIGPDGKPTSVEGVIDIGSISLESLNLIKAEEEKLMAKEDPEWREAGGQWAVAGLYYVPGKEFTFSMMRRDPPGKYEPGTSLTDLLYDSVIERQPAVVEELAEESVPALEKQVKATKSESNESSSASRPEPPSSPKAPSPPKAPSHTKPSPPQKPSSAAVPPSPSKPDQAPKPAPQVASPIAPPSPPKALSPSRPFPYSKPESTTPPIPSTPPSPPKQQAAPSMDASTVTLPSSSSTGEHSSTANISNVIASMPQSDTGATPIPSHRRAFVKTEAAIQKASKYANPPAKEDPVQKVKRLERERRESLRREAEARSEARRLEEEERKRIRDEQRRKELEERRAIEAAERAAKLKAKIDFSKSSFPNPDLGLRK